jgi:hypothetical protein
MGLELADIIAGASASLLIETTHGDFRDLFEPENRTISFCSDCEKRY